MAKGQRLIRRARVHVLLTDYLTCPRCGPSFGLILRADRLENRVVHSGILGCPNCRDSFAIEDGFADLRAPPRGRLGKGLVGPPDGMEHADVERMVALLGVLGGPGAVGLIGGPARLAGGVADALLELQIVGVDRDLRLWPEMPRISRFTSAPGLPFFGSTLRAAAVDGRLGTSWVAEAVRVVVPRGRVVVSHAQRGSASWLREMGLTVLAEDAETVVAARS